MVKKNNTETNKLTNQRLSIQIGLSGLSFSILDVPSNTVVALKNFKKNRTLTPFELMDYLKFVVDTEHLKEKTYNQVTAVYRNELSTLVPKALFDEENIADYLKFNNKILPTDFISYDELSNDTVNVYVPLVNINNYLYDTFGTFTYKHYSTLFVEYALNKSNSQEQQMMVNVDDSQLELAVIKNNKLLFYNSFGYSSKEDFIYYILFTAEQLQMNPDVFPLLFTGNINQDTELYKIAYKYVRNVAIERYDPGLQYSTNLDDSTSSMILLTSLTCE